MTLPGEYRAKRSQPTKKYEPEQHERETYDERTARGHRTEASQQSHARVGRVYSLAETQHRQPEDIEAHPGVTESVFTVQREPVNEGDHCVAD